MRRVSTLSARSTKSTDGLRNPSVPVSPHSPQATIQTLTPTQHCSSSLTWSVILPALSPLFSACLPASIYCLLTVFIHVQCICACQNLWCLIYSLNILTLSFRGLFSYAVFLSCLCLLQVYLKQIPNSSCNDDSTVVLDTDTPHTGFVW